MVEECAIVAAWRHCRGDPGKRHKPVLGRMQLEAMRFGIRVVNADPALKQRITDKVLRARVVN